MSLAIEYRAEVDGLRSLAIVPVVFFHAGFKTFGGGFVGVDVFFVISGYLIASIILAEMGRGEFTLASFYERRARRILPPLFVVMAASFAMAWLWMMPEEMKRFSDSLISVPLFVSNFQFWRESGYFGTTAELKPLLHMWSLAVEEQYYVLFPLFLIVAWRFGKGFIGVVLGIVGAASLVLAEWGVVKMPEAAFFLLPARAWELLLGVAVALVPTHVRASSTISSSVRQMGGLGGLVLIGYPVFCFDHGTEFPGIHALPPTLGAALIILLADHRTWVGRLLSCRPLVGIGLVSYSAYLWHQPLFAFARIRSITPPSQFAMSVLAILAFILAWASWRYIERPFRDRTMVGRSPLLAFSVTLSAAFVALGLLGHYTGGYEQHFVTSRLNDAERTAYQLINRSTRGNLYQEMRDDGECRFWVRAVDAQFRSRFAECTKKFGKAIIVLGDSHAMNIYNALFEAAQGRLLVGISQGGCRPHQHLSHCHYEGFEAFLQSEGAQVESVLFTQSGAYLLKDQAGRADGPELYQTGTPYVIDQVGIEADIEYLDKLSTHARVRWLGPYVEPRADLRFSRGRTLAEFHIGARALQVFADLDARIGARVQADNGTVEYIPFSTILRIEPDFLVQEQCLTFRDGDHFSVCGENLVGKFLAPVILGRRPSGEVGRR